MSDNLNTLLDVSDDPLLNKGERPTFLTVLCIFSFVGVGCWFVYDLYKIYLIQMMGSALELIKQMQQPGMNKGDTALMDQTFRYYKYGYVLVGTEAGGNLAILLGVILMWKQKAMGFLIYVAGQVVPVVIYYAVMGYYSGDLGAWNWISYIPYAFMLAFILMYALNLKHMKR